MSEEIVRLAGRGDGVTVSGRHVALTAPGDQVENGSVVPGPHHVTPPCRHFPRCGGCQLQHVDDEAYSGFVLDRIVSALAAQGLPPPAMCAVHLSPPRSRRRATLHAQRLGRRVVLGFNEGASHRIIDMVECHVLHPELFALVAPLRAFLAELLGARGAATASLTRVDQGVDVVLVGVPVDGLAATEALTAFAETNRLARLSVDEGYGSEPRWEPRPVTITLGGVAVPFPSGGFLQATADGEAALVSGVRDAIAGAPRVADLFAGLGTFALALLPSVRVLAAEGSMAAAAALRSAASSQQRMLVVEHRDLFRRPLDVAELARFDALVLDPPRAGAKEQVEAIARSAVPRLAYGSCNPATFARDAKALVDGGYRLDWIRPVGQFRWSTHVELVAAFSRAQA